jgi:Arc/MetJ family transcription regulator
MRNHEPAFSDSCRIAGSLLGASVYIDLHAVYTPTMSKRLVDIDDTALEAAQAELGTATIKATVNEALRRAGARRAENVREALGVLATAALSDRDDAWR